jgi:hypothetical protein
MRADATEDAADAAGAERVATGAGGVAFGVAVFFPTVETVLTVPVWERDKNEGMNER